MEAESHWSGGWPSGERRTPGDQGQLHREDQTKGCRALQAETEGPRDGCHGSWDAEALEAKGSHLQ